MKRAGQPPEFGFLERAHLTPITVLVVGILSIVLLVVTHIVSERQTTQHFLLDSALVRSEVKMATSHLWLEEHLSGDQTIDTERIWTDLNEARTLIQTVLQGGETLPAGRRLEPLEDPELRLRAERLADRLERFSDLSVQRMNIGPEGDEAKAGATLDQAYDEVFLGLLKEGGELRAALGRRWTRQRGEARQRLGGIVAAWAVLVVAAFLGLWGLERRRKEADQALRQREAELREAQKMEAVGRLAGGLAHDINNYLGAIRGYCEVARMKGESGPALKRRMDDAITTTDAVSDLIRQLLAFSRRQPVEPEVVDLNAVTRNLESMVDRLIGEDILVETKLAPDLRPIEIDPSQIDQILINLVVNARDAMPSGGRITIETRNLVPDTDDHRRHAVAPGRYAFLVVSDTGDGMPEEVREKIFEPFFTTKKGDGHSGLGLATIYAIVRQNGGFIVVDSEVGEGTTFKILLPATDREPTVVSEAEESAVHDAGPTSRLLLVEDHDAMRAATQELLEALGHNVATAADAHEALRRLVDEGEPADLLITDVIMPGLSGKELVDRLRESRPELRYLFISGYTDKVKLQHGLSEERVDFLAKPFAAEDLARKVQEMLERQPAVG